MAREKCVATITNQFLFIKYLSLSSTLALHWSTKHWTALLKMSSWAAQCIYREREWRRARLGALTSSPPLPFFASQLWIGLKLAPANITFLGSHLRQQQCARMRHGDRDRQRRKQHSANRTLERWLSAWPIITETSQKLRMLTSVTLNCQATKIVMNSGSQLSEL